MHGNLWEWCEDWHGEYPSRDVTDPKGPSVGIERVHRDGCYLVEGIKCRSAARNWDPPGDTLLLPGVSGGDGSGEVRGVSVLGFERGNVLSLDFGGVFDEIAYHFTKFLLGSLVPDIIQLRIEASLRDRLHWLGLQSLG